MAAASAPDGAGAEPRSSPSPTENPQESLPSSSRPIRASAVRFNAMSKALASTGDWGSNSSTNENSINTDDTKNYLVTQNAQGWLPQQQQQTKRKRGSSSVSEAAAATAAAARGEDSGGGRSLAGGSGGASGVDGEGQSGGGVVEERKAAMGGRAKRSAGAGGGLVRREGTAAADGSKKSNGRGKDKEKKIGNAKARGSGAPVGATVGFGAAGNVACTIPVLLESFLDFTAGGGGAAAAAAGRALGNSKGSGTMAKGKKVANAAAPLATDMSVVWSALDEVLSDLPSTEDLNLEFMLSGKKRARTTGGAGAGADEGSGSPGGSAGETSSPSDTRNIQAATAAAAATASAAQHRKQRQSPKNESIHEGSSGDTVEKRAAAARVATQASVAEVLLDVGVQEGTPLAAAGQSTLPKAKNEEHSLHTQQLQGSAAMEEDVSVTVAAVRGKDGVAAVVAAVEELGVAAGARAMEEDDSAAEVLEDDVCAKTRGLPENPKVANEMAECQAALMEAEAKAAGKLKKLSVEIDSLRFRPDSIEHREFTQWAEATLEAFKPLDERMMVDRAARNDKLELARRRNEKMQEEENLAVCYVCDNGDFNEHDQIVFCERCCVAVHASCYNVVGVEKIDKWYCDFCQDFIAKAKCRLQRLEDERAKLQPPPPMAATTCKNGRTPPSITIRKKPASVSEALSPLSKQTPPTTATTNALGRSTVLSVEAWAARASAAAAESEKTTMGMLELTRGEKDCAGSGGTPGWNCGGSGADSAAIPAQQTETGPSVAGHAKSNRSSDTNNDGQVARRGRQTGAAATAISAAAAAAVAAVTSGLFHGGNTGNDKRGTRNGGGGGAGGASNALEVDPMVELVAARLVKRGEKELRGKASGAGSRARTHNRKGSSSSSSSRNSSPKHANKRHWDDSGGAKKGRNDAGVGGSVAGGRDGGKQKSETGDEAMPARRLPQPSALPPVDCRAIGGGDDNELVSGSNSGDKMLNLNTCVHAAATTLDGEGAAAGAATNVQARQKLADEDIADGSISLYEEFEKKRLQLGEDIADARVAVEEALEVVGVEFPSRQKGPRDKEAVCQLCNIPGGAYLRASKGKSRGRGMGWCHCLCALSLQLPIQNRIVQTKGCGPREAGQAPGPICGLCKRAGRGGLMPCAEKGCTTKFHPLCCKVYGGSAERGPQIPTKDWSARCPEHAVRPPEAPGGDFAAAAAATAEAAAAEESAGKRRKGGRNGSRGRAAAAGAAVPARRGSRGGGGPRTSRVTVNGASSASAVVEVSVVAVDDEVAILRREAEEALAVGNEPACPEGKCHRCRKVQPWAAACSKCPQRYCASCIASQRESPVAVLIGVKAAAEAERAGRPQKCSTAFMCFACRGNCLCSTCNDASTVRPTSRRPIAVPVSKPPTMLRTEAAAAEAAAAADAATATAMAPAPAPAPTPESEPESMMEVEADMSTPRTPSPRPIPAKLPTQAEPLPTLAASKGGISKGKGRSKPKKNVKAGPNKTTGVKRRPAPGVIESAVAAAAAQVGLKVPPPTMTGAGAGAGGAGVTSAGGSKQQQQLGRKRQRSGPASAKKSDHPCTATAQIDGSPPVFRKQGAGTMLSPQANPNDAYNPWSEIPGTAAGVHAASRADDARGGNETENIWNIAHLPRSSSSNGILSSPRQPLPKQHLPQTPLYGSGNGSVPGSPFNSVASFSPASPPAANGVIAVGDLSSSPAVVAAASAAAAPSPAGSANNGYNTLMHGIGSAVSGNDASNDVSFDPGRVQETQGVAQGKAWGHDANVRAGKDVSGSSGGGSVSGGVGGDFVQAQAQSNRCTTNPLLTGRRSLSLTPDPTEIAGKQILQQHQQLLQPQPHAAALNVLQSPTAGSVHAGAMLAAARGATAQATSATSEVVARAIVVAKEMRARALAALEAARRAAAEMREAKTYSDSHNKAAMQKVEEATTLKDSLLVSNELVNGYAGLSLNAHMKLKSASKEESAAVGRLRAAQMELAAAEKSAAAAFAEHERLAAAAATSISLPPWSLGNHSAMTPSSLSSSSSTVSSSGRTSSLSEVNDGGSAGSSSPLLCNADSLNTGLAPPAMPNGLLQGVGIGSGGGGSPGDGRSSPLSASGAAAAAAAAWASSGNNDMSWSAAWWQASNNDNGGSGARSSTPPSANTSPPLAMTPPGGGGGGAMQRAAVAAAAAAATAAAAASTNLERCKQKVVACKQEAMVATFSAQELQKNLQELTRRHWDAEESRSSLVKDTQVASEHASKASQAAMRYEAEASSKKQHADRAAAYAKRLAWEAKKTEMNARRTIQHGQQRRAMEEATRRHLMLGGSNAEAAAAAALAARVAAATVDLSGSSADDHSSAHQ